MSVSVCLNLCVCVGEREIERVIVRVHASMRPCVCVFVSAGERKESV